MQQGIFIVIDGTDGSGKQTQTDLLVARLEKEGYPVMKISTPTYGDPSAALIEAYLRGDFGKRADDVNPYVASSFYAVDRFAHSYKIKEALKKGTIVVADRYVTANMGHQGSKFKNREERRAFITWNYDFEFKKGALPEPDLNIILHVPTDVSMKLVDKRGNAKDIHEADPDHLKRAEETYLEIAEMFDNMRLIECTKNGEMLSRETIHELIWDNVQKMLK